MEIFCRLDWIIYFETFADASMEKYQQLDHADCNL